MRKIWHFFHLETVPARSVGTSLLLAAIVFSFTKVWILKRHLNVNTAAGLGTGIVIEEIAKNSENRRAGLQKGDVVFSWRRGIEKGQITSPFDISSVETEQAPLGAVTLEGERLGARHIWTLAHSPWGINSRPNLSAAFISLYARSNELLRRQQFRQAADFSLAAASTMDGSSQTVAAWFLFHVADSLSLAHQWREADEFFARSVKTLQIPEMEGRAQIQTAWAKTFEQHNQWSYAEDHYQQALAEDRKIDAQGLAAAAGLQNLARFNFIRGDLAAAAPYAEQALRIRGRLAPGSLEFARTLNYLGAFAQRRGDLARAEEYHRKALAIEERVAPRSLDVARSSNNLGAIALQRGDLAKAEEYYLRDLSISTDLGASALETSYTWNNLGIVAQSRGDLARAEHYFHRGLAIQESLAPGSLSVALALNNLGTVLQGRGNLDQAEQCFRRALAIQEKLSPKSLEYSTTLDSLGVLLRVQRHFAQSKHCLLRSLSIRKKLAPGTLAVAETTNDLGDVFRDRGALSRAEACYRSALIIRRQFAPHSVSYAESLASIASLFRNRHQLRAAAFYYRNALDVLDAQVAHLGGSGESRWRFRGQYERYYFDYIDLLLDENMPSRAFETLERSRARTLVEMLVEGHIDFSHGIGPKLVQRKHVLQKSLSALSDERIRTGNPSHLAALEKKIDELLSEQQEVESEIRRENPAYAALTEPKPSSTKDIQHELDQDTVILEYLLGEDRSYIFALTHTSLTVYQLPKRRAIETIAHDLYERLTTLSRPFENHGSNPQLMHLAAGEIGRQTALISLSRIVLGPVASIIKKQKRVVVVSDGVLRYVPFAALAVPESPYRHSMIRDHEVVNLPSVSVLIALRREEATRTSKPERVVAVLADPVFSADDARVDDRPHGNTYGSSKPPAVKKRSIRSLGNSDLRSENTVLPRLISSRQEADAIMAITPKGQALEALDFDANRSVALSSDLSHYRILHFATHGIIDSGRPELSGLVFSLVDRKGRPQIGFVGLQDIYNMNAPVNLVVLSACDTALGAEIRSEGLIGLTRGFMYAGASRVIASLWQVDDVATAELMHRLYDSMERHNLSPAAALRDAQIEMSKETRWSDPYYWAGFTIEGEWRAPNR